MPEITYHRTVVRRKAGHYAIMALVPDKRGVYSSCQVGEVRRHGKVWRHLIAPEREFRRLRDCVEDLVYALEHPWRDCDD